MLCGACMVPVVYAGWLGYCWLAGLPKKKRNLGLLLITIPILLASSLMGKFLFIDEPLISVAADGDLEAVQRYIKWGADPNVIGEGNAPICFAIANGHEEVAIYLLDHGANPKTECSDGPILEMAKSAHLSRLASRLSSSPKN